MVEIENVSVSYRDGAREVPALRGFSLRVRRGEWVGVTGSNGSGKSTISRVINGLLRPAEGSVKVAGLDLAEKANRELVKRHVQLVFQNPDAQTIGANPVEDVAFGLENRGVPREEMLRRIDKVLAQVGLEGKRFDETSTLSGGQRQRLAIASCLALEPDCLIFDEATSMLDPVGRKEIFRAARSLWKQGMTVIWVTQRLDELLEAERVVVMEEGKAAFEGSARALFYLSEVPDRLGWEVPAVVEIGKVLAEQGVEMERLPLREEDVEELVCGLTFQM